MEELIIVVICSLVVILALMYCVYVQVMSYQTIKAENEILRAEIEAIKSKNYDLRSALEFEKQVSKTFSDGIDALTKKN